MKDNQKRKEQKTRNASLLSSKQQLKGRNWIDLRM